MFFKKCDVSIADITVIKFLTMTHVWASETKLHENFVSCVYVFHEKHNNIPERSVLYYSSDTNDQALAARQYGRIYRAWYT